MESKRGKVQRKVRNGVAQLAAAGSSLDRPQNHGNSCGQRLTNIHAGITAEIFALGPACVSAMSQLKREQSLSPDLSGSPENYAIFQRDILRRHF
jgi:hypothetical protein